MVQLSHSYMTTGKAIALTRQTFVGTVMSLLFNMLSRLVIAFLPRSKCLLISWLLRVGVLKALGVLGGASRKLEFPPIYYSFIFNPPAPTAALST